MYTGDDGESRIEELQPDDPKLESLGRVSGCSLQVTEAGEFSDFHPAPRRRWQKEHLPNQTGTKAAYRPQGSVLAGGRRAKATGDYEPWTPP